MYRTEDRRGLRAVNIRQDSINFRRLRLSIAGQCSAGGPMSRIILQDQRQFKSFTDKSKRHIWSTCIRRTWITLARPKAQWVHWRQFSDNSTSSHWFSERLRRYAATSEISLRQRCNMGWSIWDARWRQLQWTRCVWHYGGGT